MTCWKARIKFPTYEIDATYWSHTEKEAKEKLDKRFKYGTILSIKAL